MEKPRLLAAAAIVLVFLGLRISLLLVRQPFFDESFTLWITARPLGPLFQALSYDSGPPLYYVIVRALRWLGADQIAHVRLLSLFCALVTLVTLLRERTLGDARLIAAGLLAVFPPHVYYSTEARPYAMCAMWLAFAVIALHRWIDAHGRGRRELVLAVFFLLLAACTHYYGVLFFPLPFLAGLMTRQRLNMIRGFVASLLAGALFIPGFILAAQQPAESVAWMREPVWQLAMLLGSALQRLTLVGAYADAFIPVAPLAVQIVAAVIVALIVVRTRGSAFWPLVVIACGFAAVVFFTLAGKSVYFPSRYESVIAAAVAIWLALCLMRWSRTPRILLGSAIAAVGLLTSILLITINLGASPDPYLAMGKKAARLAPGTTVLVSGLAWLPVALERGEGKLFAFPREQAMHPGWRARKTERELESEVQLLRQTLPERFLWIGEEHAPELAVLRRHFRLGLIEAQRPLVMVECRRRSTGEP